MRPDPVRRLACAVDCGTVVNRDTVQSQVQSPIIFGVTATLSGEIKIKDGRLEQGNFDIYRMLRMNEAPPSTSISSRVPSLPAGWASPGPRRVVPAIANAVFAASGKRFRKMPVDTTG